jgi:type IV secretion system protein VirB1
MPMVDVPLALLLEACAPQVSPVTMAAIVAEESGGDALIIHDNRTAKIARPKSLEEAITLAQELIDAGDSVDLGLAQINSANLRTLGLDVESVFEPCSNLHAAQTLLLDAWTRSGGDLGATLAAYNTGCSARCSPERQLLGAAYSASVYARAGMGAPGILGKHPTARGLERDDQARRAITSSLTPRSGDLSQLRHMGITP